MVVESQTQPRAKSSPSSRRPAVPGDQAQQISGHLPPPEARTKTDNQSPPVWLGHEPVIQLREWATDTVHPLPGDVAECVIGSGPFVELQLIDPKSRVSRQHALLVREGSWWKIADLRSKNGLLQDRAPSDKFPLVPGVEIGIGGLTLIAENQTLVQLRGYLARVLGWDAASRSAVDLALRAIRDAANRRAPLLLAGGDDLVAVARQIHRRSRVLKAPFVVCGPQLRELDVNVRVMATPPDPTTAFELAAGGTMCVCAEELRGDLDRQVEASRDPDVWVQLIICANKPSKRLTAVAPSIVVPALARRDPDDIQRIVFEYAVDGIHELGATLSSFTEANREWVVKHAASSFTQIEIATLRLIARNHAGNVNRAAARLGVSHVALGKWFRRRGLVP